MLGVAAAAVLLLVVGTIVVLASPDSEDTGPTAFDAGADVVVVSDGIDGSVSAEVASDEGPAAGFARATEVYQVVVDGAFDGSAEVHLPLFGPPPESGVLLGATAQRPGEWVTSDQPLEIVDGRAVIPTTHFSLFAAFWIAADDVRGEIGRVLDGLTGGATAEAEPPTCDSEQQARDDGYAIDSDDGDAVFWCLGVDEGATVLKVVNNRPYIVALVRSGPGRVLSDSAGGLAANLSQWVSGDWTIISPGDTAVLDVTREPGTRPLRLRSSFDGLGTSLYQLEVGVRTALAFLTRLGFARGLTVVEAMDTLLQLGECSLEGDEGAGEFLASCLGPDNLLRAFGPSGAILAAAVFVGPLWAFFDSSITAAIDLVRQRDEYRIVVHRPEAVPVLADGAGIASHVINEPARSLLSDLEAALGPPDEQTGFVEIECLPGEPARENLIRWGGLTVTLFTDPSTGTPALLSSWLLDESQGEVPDELQVDPAIGFDTTWRELSELGATWDEFYGSWELDGLIGTLTTTAPDDGSTAAAFGAGSTGLLGC